MPACISLDQSVQPFTRKGGHAWGLQAMVHEHGRAVRVDDLLQPGQRKGGVWVGGDVVSGTDSVSVGVFQGGFVKV